MKISKDEIIKIIKDTLERIKNNVNDNLSNIVMSDIKNSFEYLLSYLYSVYSSLIDEKDVLENDLSILDTDINLDDENNF